MIKEKLIGFGYSEAASAVAKPRSRNWTKTNSSSIRALLNTSCPANLYMQTKKKSKI